MQRRRRYDLKLSGLTGHVLDLFLLLTNSPDPTTGYASSWSGLLDGKLCAQNYMAMSIWFTLLESYDIRSTFDETIIWIWLMYRYVHLRSKLSLFLQTKKRCYGQVSNLVHIKQVETITFNFLILFSFACVRVHIQSACIIIIIIIMMTFRFNLLVLWLFDN